LFATQLKPGDIRRYRDLAAPASNASRIVARDALQTL
jgi:hypothetical protein